MEIPYEGINTCMYVQYMRAERTRRAPGELENASFLRESTLWTGIITGAIVLQPGQNALSQKVVLSLIGESLSVLGSATAATDVGPEVAHKLLGAGGSSREFTLLSGVVSSPLLGDTVAITLTSLETAFVAGPDFNFGRIAPAYQHRCYAQYTVVVDEDQTPVQVQHGWALRSDAEESGSRALFKPAVCRFGDVRTRAAVN